MKWREKMDYSSLRFCRWIGISRSRLSDWQERYGQDNEHNSPTPRYFWLTEEERQKIIEYFKDNPLNGYRRLSYMMIDDNVVCVCPGTVYNVLKKAGLIGRSTNKPSKKGQGFQQPLVPHAHWHIDISYINLSGTFYYLCSVMDGYSRSIVNWDLKEAMKESDVELVLERARESYPKTRPRIISDNGPQFIAKDFKEYIRLCGMTHVRTAPYYPQSNGKIERWHGELKRECVRPQQWSTYDEAKKGITEFIGNYNDVRLHSAIGFVTPKAKLEGRAEEIIEGRKRKLAIAQESRKRINLKKYQAREAQMQL